MTPEESICRCRSSDLRPAGNTRDEARSSFPFRRALGTRMNITRKLSLKGRRNFDLSKCSQ
jgi:hypothetical protein